MQRRFYPQPQPMALADIITLVSGKTPHESNLKIHDIADMQAASANDIIFYDSPKYKTQLKESKAGFCQTRANLLPELPENMVGIVVDDPRTAFAAIAQTFYPEVIKQAFSTEHIDKSAEIDESAIIAPTAVIGKNVKIAKNVYIAPGAVIYDGAEIGDNSIIGANAIVGTHVKLGNNAQIGSHTSIEYTIAGDHFHVQEGSRIGVKGYGFKSNQGEHTRSPQLGSVVIGDNVEIDANAVIEKGALSDTKIDDGTKIGSQVMIGHNVQTGKNCMILAQAGIAGSVTMGDSVTIAPQAGVADHITIGDNAVIYPQSGVSRDVEAGTIVEGSPAALLDRRELVRRRRGEQTGRGGRG